MAQTLTSLLVHIVFSTKHRVPIITPEVEPDLFAYMGGILKNNSSPLLAAGVPATTCICWSRSRKTLLSDLLKDVKKDSSSWIKTKGRVFKDFHWQDGYGAFSISRSEVSGVKLYIANQKAHPPANVSGRIDSIARGVWDRV